MSENVRHYDLAEKDDWVTPQWFVDGINQHAPIALDPCAGERTWHGDINLRLENGDDGLESDWGELCRVYYCQYVYVNPPFSYKQEWVDKCVEEYQSDSIDAVFLLIPDATDVKSYWHGAVDGKSGITDHAEYVWFSEGRMKFVDPDTGEQANSPTNGISLSILAESDEDVPDDLLAWLSTVGWVVEEAV